MSIENKNESDSKPQSLFERTGRRISAWLAQYSNRFRPSQVKVIAGILTILFGGFCFSLIISSMTGSHYTPVFSIQRITQPPVNKRDSINHEQSRILRRLMERLERTPQVNLLFDSLPAPWPENNAKDDSIAMHKPGFLH